MQVHPGPDAFKDAYDRGTAQVVTTRLVGDLETPVSAYLKVAGQHRYSFLLESVEGGAVRARYSIIGTNPDLIFRSSQEVAQLHFPGTNRKPEQLTEPPLQALRTLVESSKIALPDNLPPMAAGVFGYLGYDMVSQMERVPSTNPDALDVPDTLFIRPKLVVIFDSVKDEITVVTPVRPEKNVSAERAYARAIDRLTETVDLLDEPLDRSADEMPGDIETEFDMNSNTSQADYLAMVDRAKDYIGAGDIFQVVLSQRFETPFSLPPFALYRALRRTNPAPFLFFLNFDDFAVIGSSPEILVRLRDGEVTVRPIAGTRPRGATPGEDRQNAEDLLADPKERAEHLMLLDLGRNDVGRVAEIGTVRVTDKFFIEYYSHVMHIVSNVTGKIDEKHDALDALVAGFPAGTVSGAPKVRAMEIIDELEKDKRGPYAGCVGYFSADGAMDTCIILRTAVVKDGTMYIQAGAGIVADSVPQLEYEECHHKARALFRAAEEAARFASAAKRAQ